ncbi:ArsR/SmtB family transcription factor [Sulfurimonas sp.]
MQEVVQLAKILSDMNRVKIIALMLREKELCVCEICDTLELSQPLVSRHLKQMREADVVQTRQSGKWIIYSLCEDKIFTSFVDKLKEDSKKLPPIVTCSTR